MGCTSSKLEKQVDDEKSVRRLNSDRIGAYYGDDSTRSSDSSISNQPLHERFSTPATTSSNPVPSSIQSSRLNTPLRDSSVPPNSIPTSYNNSSELLGTELADLEVLPYTHPKGILVKGTEGNNNQPNPPQKTGKDSYSSSYDNSDKYSDSSSEKSGSELYSNSSGSKSSGYDSSSDKSGHKNSVDKSEPKASIDKSEPRSSNAKSDPRPSNDKSEPRSSNDKSEPRSSNDKSEPRSSNDKSEPRSSYDKSDLYSPSEKSGSKSGSEYSSEEKNDSSYGYGSDSSSQENDKKHHKHSKDLNYNVDQDDKADTAQPDNNDIRSSAILVETEEKSQMALAEQYVPVMNNEIIQPSHHHHHHEQPHALSSPKPVPHPEDHLHQPLKHEWKYNNTKNPVMHMEFPQNTEFAKDFYIDPNLYSSLTVDVTTSVNTFGENITDVDVYLHKSSAKEDLALGLTKNISVQTPLPIPEPEPPIQPQSQCPPLPCAVPGQTNVCCPPIQILYNPCQAPIQILYGPMPEGIIGNPCGQAPIQCNVGQQIQQQQGPTYPQSFNEKYQNQQQLVQKYSRPLKNNQESRYTYYPNVQQQQQGHGISIQVASSEPLYQVYPQGSSPSVPQSYYQENSSQPIFSASNNTSHALTEKTLISASTSVSQSYFPPTLSSSQQNYAHSYAIPSETSSLIPLINIQSGTETEESVKVVSTNEYLSVGIQVQVTSGSLQEKRSNYEGAKSKEMFQSSKNSNTENVLRQVYRDKIESSEGIRIGKERLKSQDESKIKTETKSGHETPNRKFSIISESLADDSSSYEYEYETSEESEEIETVREDVTLEKSTVTKIQEPTKKEKEPVAQKEKSETLSSSSEFFSEYSSEFVPAPVMGQKTHPEKDVRPEALDHHLSIHLTTPNPSPPCPQKCPSVSPLVVYPPTPYPQCQEMTSPPQPSNGGLTMGSLPRHSYPFGTCSTPYSLVEQSSKLQPIEQPSVPQSSPCQTACQTQFPPCRRLQGKGECGGKRRKSRRRCCSNSSNDDQAAEDLILGLMLIKQIMQPPQPQQEALEKRQSKQENQTPCVIFPFPCLQSANPYCCPAPYNNCPCSTGNNTENQGTTIEEVNNNPVFEITNVELRIPQPFPDKMTAGNQERSIQAANCDCNDDC